MASKAGEFAITLQPKQRQLLDLCCATGTGAATTIGYGGARGGAKSGAVRRIALVLAYKYPGTVSHIIQRTSKDLYDGHLCKLRVEFPHLHKYWVASHNEYQLPNGSRIAFRYADTADDVVQLTRGPEPTWAFIDQAELFMPDDLTAIKIGVRNPAMPAGLAKMVLTFNPGGPATAYLRRIFHLKQYIDNEIASDYAFIHAVGWDNYEWFRSETDITPAQFCDMPDAARFERFIKDTSYGRVLWGLPESQRMGQLYGSFDQFAGQYYADVWDTSTATIPHELANRIIQPWWRRWLATDWGFSHYASTGWYAAGTISPSQVRDYFGVESRTPVRVVIKYRELVCNDVAEPDLAALIVARTPQSERRTIRDHWMSPDAWAKRGSANTVAEQMEPVLTRDGLVPLGRADNDRVGGWRLLYNGWAAARRLRKPSEPFRQADTDVPVFLVSQECPEAIAAVPMLICKDGNPQDIEKRPGAVEDDVADETRYALKSYISADPSTPADVVARETYESYQDPTDRAMAMLHLRTRQSESTFIHRRRRA